MACRLNAARAVALLVLFSPPASAQTPAPSPAAPAAAPAPSLEGLGEFEDFEDLDLDDLLNVTVSIATGETQTPEDAPNIVTVITEEEIERSGARTLAEVLELLPGIEVVVDNLGKNSISMRGVTGANTLGGYDVAVLVLFNGHRLNEDISGSAALANLEYPVDNIEKIEFIRGPASALYGARAFLGVMNIVTHSAHRFRGTEVSAGVGSFGTQQYNVLFGRGFGGVGVAGFLQVSDTDGPDLPVASDLAAHADSLNLLVAGRRGIPYTPVSRAPGFTDGDHRALDANLQATYGGATVNGRYTNQVSGGYLGLLDTLGVGNRLEGRQLALDATYARSLRAATSLTVRGELTRTELRQKQELFPPGFIRDFPNTPPYVVGALLDVHNNDLRTAASARLDHRTSPANHLTLGLEAERSATFDLETFASFAFDAGATPLPSLRQAPSSIPDSRRTLVAAFVQDTWEPTARLGLTAGLRVDRYSDVGTTVNPRAGVVWRAARGVNLKVLYGRAFRAPAFIELYSRVPGLRGSPDLDPATVNSIETSASLRRRNLRLTVNYYANFVRDLIVREGDVRALTGVLVNHPGLDSQGYEVEVKRTFGVDHSAFLNYSYQRARDLQTGDRPPDVPSHFANVGGTLTLPPGISVTPTVSYRSSRPRQGEGLDIRDPLPAVTLVNLSARWREAYRGLSLFATVSNLFDERYADPAPFELRDEYPRPGRRLFVRATWRF